MSIEPQIIMWPAYITGAPRNNVQAHIFNTSITLYQGYYNNMINPYYMTGKWFRDDVFVYDDTAAGRCVFCFFKIFNTTKRVRMWYAALSFGGNNVWNKTWDELWNHSEVMSQRTNHNIIYPELDEPDYYNYSSNGLFTGTLPMIQKRPSPIIYLGDFATINSDNINLGYSKLSNIKDAVSDQDATSFKQLKDTKLALETSLTASNVKITSLETQMTNIMAGTTAYDSFKKVIDLVNAMDAADDLSVAKSIALLTQSIAAEETRAIAEEGSILTNLNNFKTLTYGPDKQALENNDSRIEGIVTANRTDYDNKLSTEQTERKIADNKIQANMITSILVSPSSMIYSSNDAPSGNIIVDCPIDGWFYTNKIYNANINWRFIPSEGLQIRDLNHLCFNAWFANNASLPFIELYTKRKNDGTDEDSYYNTKLRYVIAMSKDVEINSSSNNIPYQCYIGFNNSNVDTLPNFGLQRKELSISVDSESMLERILETDEILYITLSTNKNIPMGSVNFVVNNICYCTNNGIIEHKLVSSSLTSALISEENSISLESERLRAKTAEEYLRTDLSTLSATQISDKAILDGRITGLNTSLSNSLGSEISRALAAEGVIASNLATHISGYNTDKTSMSSLISNVSSQLTTELATRSSADTALTTRINNIESSLLSLTKFITGDTYITGVPFNITYLHS
jgi:hypothetical protein